MLLNTYKIFEEYITKDTETEKKGETHTLDIHLPDIVFIINIRIQQKYINYYQY